MSKRQDSLENFLRMFDTTDDQGWCDIGYETSEKITRSYAEEDWISFIGALGGLNEDVYLGVIEIMPLIPDKYHLSVIEELLVYAKSEAWLEALSIYYETLNKSIEAADSLSTRVNLLSNFEKQFISWVNFKVDESEAFSSYYERYSHLISKEARDCYASLCRSHNKSSKKDAVNRASS
ncbi:hypothetical protein KO528_13510 [Saccharophagus degradans]|uniref:hypothetical protein n=1 Tax=Saccharophagus degradans TaxID=86304 RepID=UPI001C07F006|nr:hypothetical protein [Saccharophagus degradans]MBU2986373.1 hypothetical protein [Saccharophagus degradans]